MTSPAATVLETALDLIDCGIPCFPVRLVPKPGGGVDKRPAVERWNIEAKDGGNASIDPKQIEAWFKDGSYLIGVPTGPLGGFDALDIDPRKNGEVWLAGQSFPATRQHTTLSGGVHYLFRHLPGMRNSTSKIAPGVDVRAENGFIVWWPGHGYPFIDHPLQQLPEWPAGVAKKATERRYGAKNKDGSVPLDRRIPPSAAAVVELLNRLPNPEEVSRDTYVDVMHATKGCIDALRESDQPLDPEDEAAIAVAAVGWAEKWPGCKTDEAQKWADDWSRCSAPLAGWQTLQRVAGELIHGYREEIAAAEFATAETREPGPLILSPDTPFKGAQRFVQDHHMADGHRLIHHQQDTFYVWVGPHYREAPDEEIAAEIYRFLEPVLRVNEWGRLVPYGTTQTKVSNIRHALAGATQLPQAQPPIWLDGRKAPNPAEILVCKNGLLHLPTRELLPPTPAFFTRNALDYDYDPCPPEPIEWLHFVNTIWPDDRESIDALQELFGLLLSPDTSHHKMFLIVGPPRSGKGTIGRMLNALLGGHNVAGPTLASFTQNFGLMALIDKPLAIISDARLSGRADASVVVERLLAITGGDSISLDRKYKEPWTGYLPTRFLILTNELPRFNDSSGAIATRCIVLRLTLSFLGREDHTLTDKLLKEMPGILKWGLEGYDRLKARGRFIQPASADELVRELEALTSPVKQFMQECCVVGPDHSVERATLFNHWLAWCKTQNRQFAGTGAMFGRDLAAAMPGLRRYQPRQPDGKQVESYRGIGLAEGGP